MQIQPSREKSGGHPDLTLKSTLSPVPNHEKLKTDSESEPQKTDTNSAFEKNTGCEEKTETGSDYHEITLSGSDPREKPDSDSTLKTPYKFQKKQL